MSESFRGRIGTTAAGSEPCWPARPAAPNVLIMALGDTGFAHLGCYGSDIDTPNIDATAARGIRYSNFPTSALCSPIVPADAELSPCNPDVTAWAKLDADGKRLYARMQEAFAGFRDHTDQQLDCTAPFRFGGWLHPVDYALSTDRDGFKHAAAVEARHALADQ